MSAEEEAKANEGRVSERGVPGDDEEAYKGRNDFEDENALRLWLGNNSVDFTKWKGLQAAGSKGVADLFAEIEAGKAKLTILKGKSSDGTSQCRRICDVCRVWVRRAEDEGTDETEDQEGGGKVLFETMQVRRSLVRQGPAPMVKANAYTAALDGIILCFSSPGPAQELRDATSQRPPGREIQALGEPCCSRHARCARAARCSD